MSAPLDNRQQPPRRFAAPGLLALAAVGFALLVLWHFHFRITAAAMFLVGAGAAVVVAGVLLTRAALHFDMSVHVPVLPVTSDDRRRAQLEQEKKLLLKAIKEMEFDRDTGKVDGPEAEQAIRRYRARALEILAALEPRHDAKYEEIIDRELARRLTPPDDDETEAVVAGACAQCESVNDADAVFCKKCGNRLQPDPEPAS